MSGLVLPHPEPPPIGETIEVAPGILWARLPLPFRLNHVNVYLIEDDGGWAVLDTGVDDSGCRDAWEALLAGPLSGRRLTRVIATHFHPDHVGLAGWLSHRFDLPLLMSLSEYLTTLSLHLDPATLDPGPHRRFYHSHGVDPTTTEMLLTSGHRYLRMVAVLPRTFTRLLADETLDIGGRRFAILTGGGHAPEQVMLYSADDNVFLCADQVLAKISPNISVEAIEPEGDALGIYLRSLGELRDTIPADALALPGHAVPFIGLHTRIAELIEHHETRCAAIEEACRARPQTAASLIPVLFPRPLDPQQTSFAVREVLAHINYMRRRGRLDAQVSGGAVTLTAR